MSKKKFSALLGSVILVIVAVAAGLVWMGQGSDDTSVTSLAVLPFENETGDDEIGYLSNGISENLIHALSQLPNLKVISRRSAFAFQGEDKTLQEIGEALGVDALVLGSLNQRGDLLAISAELEVPRSRLKAAAYRVVAPTAAEFMRRPWVAATK